MTDSEIIELTHLIWVPLRQLKRREFEKRQRDSAFLPSIVAFFQVDATTHLSFNDVKGAGKLSILEQRTSFSHQMKDAVSTLYLNHNDGEITPGHWGE